MLAPRHHILTIDLTALFMIWWVTCSCTGLSMLGLIKITGNQTGIVATLIALMIRTRIIIKDTDSTSFLVNCLSVV